jgi:Fic-DOC domain mobile mystery protein B
MPLWSSIPGETPIDDVSGLKIKGIATRRQLSEFEARNINRAVSKYLGKRPSRRTAPFHYSWCLKLHKEMFGRVWQWAGQIRTQNLNVGVPFYQVPEQLYALLQDLDFWSQGSTTLVEQSARLHHRSVQIHPFENGNGRWARLLANIWLRRNGSGPVLWPEQTLGETSVIRDEYLLAIRAADELDYAPLIGLHERYLQTTM